MDKLKKGNECNRTPWITMDSKGGITPTEPVSNVRVVAKAAETIYVAERLPFTPATNDVPAAAELVREARTELLIGRVMVVVNRSETHSADEREQRDGTIATPTDSPDALLT